MSDNDHSGRSEDMELRWRLQDALGERRGDTDTYDVFNYDENPSIDDYYSSFLRSRYGGPIVEAPAATAWRDPPEITDTADTDDETEFERAVATLGSQLWDYGKRVDVLAGIGEYGVLVLELSDATTPGEFETPATSANSLELAGLRAFSQRSVEDLETGDPGSGRWGEPERYKLDLDDEDDAVHDVTDDSPGEMWVHHSRVIHVPSDGLLDDEVRGRPRQEGVWNTLTDIEKTLGSAAELAYRASAWGLAINIAQDFDLEDGGDDLRENLKRWYHGLEPVLRTQGAEDIQNLGGTDIDPAPIVDPNIEALSARSGIPQKILRGNESGEIAGKQDIQSFYGTIAERREQYDNPFIVRELIERLVRFGVLPSPAGGDFEIDWPALAEESAEETSQVQLNRSKVAKNLQTAVPGYGSDEWTTYVKDGEFTDPDPTAIEPMAPAENAGAPPASATTDQPALPDGGEDDGAGDR
jgi:hypothetical protein